MLALHGHEDAVRCLSYSHDRRYLASGGEDKTVRLWDLAAGATEPAVYQHASSVEALAFVAGDKILIAGTAAGTLYAWNLANGEGFAEGAHTHGVRCMASLPRGEILITAGWDQNVILRVAPSLNQQFVLQQGAACSALACSPDGQTIAVGNEDGTIPLYNHVGAITAALADEPVPLFALAWSPDSRLLASGHADGTIRIREGAELRTLLRGHTWNVYSLTFCPDGQTLVSGSADGTVRVWNVRTGQEQRCFRWHSSWVTCVAVAPDGMTAAAGSADHTLVVWDLDA